MNRPWLIVRELRRRRVFRVAGIYVVAAWVAVQVASESFPGLEVPEVAIRYVWIAAFLGFPLALVFGWRYDITTQGIVRTAPADPNIEIDLSLRRMDYIVLGLLAVMAAGVTYQLTVQISQTRSPETVDFAKIDIHPNSIAVLPLENLSGDPEQAYFVGGMHEALIAVLSQVSGFVVTSRTSTSQFEDSDTPLRQIGRQLGVAKIIEGSVYRVSDRVRITMQLIDAETDEHLWAKNYERDLKDILRMQSEVAADIAREIEVRLTPGETARLAGAREVDPAAHDAYLRGQFHADRFTPQDVRLAEQFYRSALEIDPDYALAHVGLARIWGQASISGAAPARMVGPKWQAAALRAVELDPNLAEAQRALANVLAWYEWDWRAAEAAFERSIGLNPSYAATRVTYSHFLTAMGRNDEAAVQIERALELDPLNSFYQAMYGTQLLMAGRTDDAIEQFRNLYELDPGLGFGHSPFQGALYKKGLYAEAFAEMKIKFNAVGDHESVDALERGYAEGGITAAMRNVAELLDVRSRKQFVAPIQLVFAYDVAGETEKAFAWLEKAYEGRNPNMVYIGVMPFSERVRSDPRFEEFLRRMKLPRGNSE